MTLGGPPLIDNLSPLRPLLPNPGVRMPLAVQSPQLPRLDEYGIVECFHGTPASNRAVSDTLCPRARAKRTGALVDRGTQEWPRGVGSRQYVGKGTMGRGQKQRDRSIRCGKGNAEGHMDFDPIH
jgi:hypothetical protein